VASLPCGDLMEWLSCKPVESGCGGARGAGCLVGWGSGGPMWVRDLVVPCGAGAWCGPRGGEPGRVELMGWGFGMPSVL
jgi:hypothetical protein